MAKRMNTANVLLSSLVVAGASLITSCEDFDNGFDEAMIRYHQNFKEIFGNADPNQDWNLVKQLAMNNGGGRNTRALLPPIEQDNKQNSSAPNLNQWYENQYNLVVPGFPNYAGIYHYRNSDGDDDDVLYVSREEMWEGSTDKISSYNPVGDVTSEEVLYVSEWFRSHRNPPSLKVYWKNFFVQNISHDCDRVITMEKNEKGEDVYTCKDGEPLYQYRNPDTGETITLDSSNGNIPNEYGMDQLIAKSPNGMWTHVLDFNAGRSNKFQSYRVVPGYEHPELVDDYREPKTRLMQLFVGAGTDDFAYNSTYSTVGSTTYNEHVLVHLQFSIDQPGTYCEMHRDNCTVHEYDGYYLGFDYEAEKNDGNGSHELWEPDGFYSNWIIKLTFTPWKDDPDLTEDYDPSVREQGLLVCEDLGDWDYDFNDVVLKLEHRQEQSASDGGENGGADSDETVDKLIVTAMAAGGTLPSYVFFKHDSKFEPIENKDGNNEIHALLGNPELIPQNVGKKFGGEGTKWEYTLGDGDWNKEAFPTGFVSQVFEEEWIQIRVGDGETGNVIHRVLQNKDGNFESNDPQMMLLPTYFEWPQETRRIDWGYQYFPDWVKDHTQTHWIYYQTDKSANITERNVSRPVPSEGLVDPGLYAMYNGAVITGSIALPADADDVIYIDLVSNSNGEYSISFQNGNSTGVTAEIVDGRLMVNKHGDNGQVTIIITQAAYGNYTSASITLTIDIRQQDKLNLRWRNDITSLDIVAGTSTEVFYAPNPDNDSPANVEMTSGSDCMDMTTNADDNSVTITGTKMGKGVLTLTQENETSQTLDVTVYEIVGEGDDEYSAAAIYYENANECHVLATTFYYDYPYGAMLKVDFGDGSPSDVTLTDKNGTNINVTEIEGDDYIYFLSVDELQHLSAAPNNPSASPLIIKGAGAGSCKVYIKGLTMEDVYGTPVGSLTDDGAYIITKEEFSGYTNAQVTFMGSGSSNYKYEYGGQSYDIGWYDFGNNGPKTIDVNVSAVGEDGLKFSDANNGTISSLTAFIKEASSSAKKRTVRRR